MMGSKELQHPDALSLNIQESPAEEVEDDWEKLASSSSRASSAYSRSPSTPKSRQSSLSNLKLGASVSNLVTPRGRYPTLPISSLSAPDELKLSVLDSSSSSSSPLSRSTSSPLRPRASVGSNVKKAKKKEQGFQKNAILFILSLLGIFFLFDWWVLSRLRGALIDEENGSEFPVSLQSEDNLKR